MIVQEKKKDVQRSKAFKSKKFTIAATPESFRILSKDLYTNEVQAVIRETSTNAWDSHIEAGNDSPFDVHLPTKLEPFFSVRDYGTGLSQEDCETIYTGYFTSTKTHSNDLNGCLGLGSKSPFSIAESFTVVSRFGGKKFTYLAFKDEDGIPDLSLLTEEDSDEPNGLEIIIEVSNKIGAFEKEAIRVYQHFSKLPNINREDVVDIIKNVKDDYLINGDDFAIKNRYGTLFAVMGNVAYPIKGSNGDSFAGYINFPIGSLRFEPGRERLIESDSNKKVIEDKIAEISPKIKETILAELETKETDYDKAFYAHSVTHSAIGRSFNWDLKSYELPTCTTSFEVYNSHSRSETSKIPMGPDVEFYIETPRVKNRLINRAKNYDKTCVVLDSDQIAECKIPESIVLDPNDLPKPKTRSGQGVPFRPEKIFTSNPLNYSFKNHSWKDVDCDPDEDKYYVEISRWQPQFKAYNSSIVEAVRYLKNAGHDIPTFYGVKTVEVEKKRFKSDKTWKSFEGYVIEKLAEEAASLVSYSIGNNYNFFKQISGFYKEGLFKDISEIKIEKPRLIAICKDLGVEIAESDDIINLERQIVDRYPGIQYWELPWNFEKSDVVNVLETIDARNCSKED